MKTAAFICTASLWLWTLTNSNCFGWQTSQLLPSSEPAPPTSTQTQPPTSADQLRQVYESLDQQARQLAEDVKQNKRNDEASKQELTKLVRESFEARQKWQRAQLAESKLRIEKLQQMLEARDGLKPQIVTRRVNELLNSKTEQTPNQQPQQQGNDHRQLKNKPDMAGSSMLAAVSGSELLRTSPGDMRKLLWEKASSVLRHRSEVAEARQTLEEIRQNKNPKHELNRQAISESLKHYEAALRSPRANSSSPSFSTDRSSITCNSYWPISDEGKRPPWINSKRWRLRSSRDS